MACGISVYPQVSPHDTHLPHGRNLPCVATGPVLTSLGSMLSTVATILDLNTAMIMSGIFFSTFFGEHMSQVIKRPPVGFLTDPTEDRSTLRPANVLVYGWMGGKHTRVDLTGVCPLVRFGNGVFTVCQTANNTTSAKVQKHEQACIDNQHAFIPFAVDTFGILAPDAVDILKRVQKVMNNNVMTSGNIEYVFGRVSFAVQKGKTTQLAFHLM